MSKESDKVVRAFERALLMAPVMVEISRQRGVGKPVVKRFQCVFDHAKGIFKTLTENKVEKGDDLKLADGRRFKVEAIDPVVVEGTACYLEIKAQKADGTVPEMDTNKLFDSKTDD
jgi:hypothetical protein